LYSRSHASLLLANDRSLLTFCCSKSALTGDLSVSMNPARQPINAMIFFKRRVYIIYILYCICPPSVTCRSQLPQQHHPMGKQVRFGCGEVRLVSHSVWSLPPILACRSSVLPVMQFLHGYWRISRWGRDGMLRISYT
jgi:hypothetical protein